MESLLRRAQNIVVNYVLSRRHGRNAKNNLWRFGDSCKELNNAWGNSIVEQHDGLLKYRGLILRVTLPALGSADLSINQQGVFKFCSDNMTRFL